MTTLKIFPDVRTSSPSFKIILDICYHFFLSFLRLANTSGQLLSVSVRMRPRYLKATTLVSRWPYDLNAVSMTTQASSTYILHCFLSYPLSH